ncbi:MAG: hypothetical protein Q4A71_06055 [Actinomycetaceae bacterium]|nr:hypothetical protein [Actinomycetaceae bacterium]
MNWRKHLFATFLAATGIVLIICGIGAATWWKPDPTVLATAQTGGQLVSTRAGVLELYDSDVRVTAKGEGNMVLVVGRSLDVEGWVNDNAHVQIDGLKNLKELAFTKLGGKPLDASPKESDMWVQQKTGSGSVDMTWRQRSGGYSVLAYSERGPVSLSMQWHREVATPWVWPLLVVGAAAIVAAVILIWARIRRDHNNPVVEPSTDTVSIHVGSRTIQAPSRRSLREARARGESEIVFEGKAYPTGLIPIVQRGNEDADGEEPWADFPEYATPAMLQSEDSTVDENDFYEVDGADYHTQAAFKTQKIEVIPEGDYVEEDAWEGAYAAQAYYGGETTEEVFEDDTWGEEYYQDEYGKWEENPEIPHGRHRGGGTENA